MVVSKNLKKMSAISTLKHSWVVATIVHVFVVIEL